MSGEYREHAPSKALAPFVECFWTRAGGPGHETRVLPDGAVDIVLDLDAPSLSMVAFVVGTMTKPLVVKPSRTCDYIAVRFHPGAAQPLFGQSMREFSDQRVHLGSIWSPQVASEWSERIAEELPSRRVRLFERLLIQRFAGCSLPEPRVRTAIRTILCSGGSIPVERLSPILGLTRQHLTRLFQCHVGVGVKAFSRIIRIWSRLEKTPSESRIDWAGLAVDCGYFDQAHLIRDFRALTGLAPGRMHRGSTPREGVSEGGSRQMRGKSVRVGISRGGKLS